MNLREEPEGWHRLKEAAQRATDAHTLALIIDEMNRLLDKHQRMAENEQHCLPDSRMSHPAIRLEVQTSQSD